MKSIYKFGYKIGSDSLEWINTINKIFGIEILGIDESVSEDKNNLDNEHKWYNLFKSIEVYEPIQIGNLNILKIHPRINRYQSYVYFILIIEGDITFDNKDNDLAKEFILFRENIKTITKDFLDNFKIPFKEADFLEEDEESEKYYELLYLKNPVLINHKVHNANEQNIVEMKKMDCMNSKLFDIHFNYEYNKVFYFENDSDKFMRVLNQAYFVESDDINGEEFNKIVNHFHSIFIIFHRSDSFYKELKQMDEDLKIISLISDKLNSMWPKERLNLLLINRFINMELYNNTFFAVLELNSQIDSVLNKAKNKKARLEEKYKKQFERALYNFEDDINEDYYENLMKNMYYPLEHRTKMIADIENYFQPTDSQVERLKGINDSKVNFAIQWIMSVISVVLFGWGLIIVVYENTITINKTITDRFLFNVNFMPSYLTMIIVFIIMLVFLLCFKFIFKNSYDLSKCIRKVISENVLNLEDIDAQLNDINLDKSKKLYSLICILTMVTTFLLIKDEHSKIEEGRNIKKIEDIFKKNQ